MLTQVASLICRNFRLCQFSFVVLFCDATKVIYWKEIILAKEPTRLVMVDKMFFLKEIFLTTFHTFQNNKKGGLSLLVSINPLSFGLTFLECFYHNLSIKLISTWPDSSIAIFNWYSIQYNENCKIWISQ